MWYVDTDGTYRDVSALSAPELDALAPDGRRLYGTLHGASQHPDAPPVTPLSIEHSWVYDGKEIIDNGWTHEGLTPCGVAYHIKTGPDA
jgi:hypothetical protein